MALSQSVLATELEKLTPGTEAEGIARFAAAFRVYFRDATVDAIAANNTALAPAEVALAAALAGISLGGAALKIQAGVIAFWGAVASSAALIWVHVPPVTGATPPAGLSGLAAALTVTFTANQVGKKTLAQSADAIATTIHALQTSGTVAVGPPPASFPIL